MAYNKLGDIAIREENTLEKPESTFNQKLRRSKKFVSYDSLRFEKERLDTFIEWPIEWLNPSDLAKDGFYYLRRDDHCACVFCRGIIGAWEIGDLPRGEHLKHYPHCPFIRSQPVGNIPLIYNELLEGYSGSLEYNGKSSCPTGTDVCGHGYSSPRLMTGSYPEHNGIQHTGPKREDYLKLESRLASFTNWPERVKQTPSELSEAGFFYCGLSDHVRCYHCGNGLRNWESDDVPWVEHARWYPECTFLLVMKGKKFVNQVCQLEKVQQERHHPFETNTPTTNHISEDQLNELMQLDIIQAVIWMGFPKNHVKTMFHKQLKEKGLPFFTLESCIEAVLFYMEQETRKAIASQELLENDDQIQFSQQVESIPLTEVDVLSPSSSSSSLAGGIATQVESPSIQEIQDEVQTRISPQQVEAVTELSSTSQTREVEEVQIQSPQQVESIIVLPPTEVDVVVPSPSMSGGIATQVESDEEQTPSPQQPETVTLTQPMSIELAAQVAAGLKPPVSVTKFLEPASSVVSSPGKIRPTSLEKIRECKICMDAEIEIVFLPCYHMVACSKCTLAMFVCPICRTKIEYTIKPIVS